MVDDMSRVRIVDADRCEIDHFVIYNTLMFCF